MILSVFIGNDRVGRLADNPDGSGRIFFEYDPAWQQMGIELAPFFLPSSLSGPTGFDFPAYPAVKNLPGLMWDSLPDSWGMPLLEARIRNAGLHPSHASGTVFLSHIGSAGMGALRYEPDCATPEEENFLTSLEKIDAEALQAQQDQPPSDMGALKELLKVGSAIGGAKPKAVLYIKRDGSRISLSQVEGFDPWVVKLSTLPPGHKDSKQAGRVEYAFSLMARAAGIKMPETRLFSVQYAKGERGLFGIRRFDRGADGSRIHMQTCAALRHIMPIRGAGSYEGIARDTLELTGDRRDLIELFRRCAFNVMAGNSDDHLKNFSFLMGADGIWRLSPAYDLTPNDGPRIGNKNQEKKVQCTSVAGTFSPGRSDLLKCAKTMGVDGRVIFDQVRDALSQWSVFASDAGLTESVAAKLEADFGAA